MISVINCGGSGTRLWPLSSKSYPKQFLYVANREGTESLLQGTYRRVKDVSDRVYFVTIPEYVDLVKEQIPGVEDDQIIIEPDRRNTGPSILLGVRKVKQNHGDDVPIGSIWADHVIHDKEGFEDSILHAGKSSVEHGKMVILGIEPTYPNTGLGYIQKGKRMTEREERPVFELDHFKYQPDRQTAEDWFASGDFLWNTGYSFASVNVFEDIMKKYSKDFYEDYQKLIDASDEELDEVYRAIDDITIDAAIFERNEESLTVPASFDWMDVGNFRDLHTTSHTDDDGNSVRGDNVEIEDISNCFIRNETDQKVAVVGIDDIAVVVTEHGIAVTSKSQAQKVGDLSKRFK